MDKEFLPRIFDAFSQEDSSNKNRYGSTGLGMAIRALDRPDAKTIPIIALTANAFDEDVQRSLQVGMNAHLSKPVEPDHLFKTLGELIWEAENQ